jgi:putative oxidoreductase
MQFTVEIVRREKMSTSAVSKFQATNVSAGSASVVLLGRFLFALIFILSAPGNFKSQTIGYAASQGVPMATVAVPFAGILAILGGLSILLGYRAKIGAWLIVLFLVGVTPMMHKFWAVSDPMMHLMQFIMFLKNMAMLGGALLITQFGSGPWSLNPTGR